MKNIQSKNQLKRIKREKKEYVSQQVELDVIAYEKYRIDKLDLENPEIIQYYKKWKYPSYLSTRYWKKVKEVIHSKYKTCEICNWDKNLQVHHTTYAIKGKELLGDNLQKLMLVCRGCHLLIHGGLTETKRLRRASKTRNVGEKRLLEQELRLNMKKVQRQKINAKFLKRKLMQELKAKRRQEHEANAKRNLERKAIREIEMETKKASKYDAKSNCVLLVSMIKDAIDIDSGVNSNIFIIEANNKLINNNVHGFYTLQNYSDNMMKVNESNIVDYKTTSNVSSICALLSVLERINSFNIPNITLIITSKNKWLLQILTGEYRAKMPVVVDILSKCKPLLSGFIDIQYVLLR